MIARQRAVYVEAQDLQCLPMDIRRACCELMCGSVNSIS